jgi:hypothetical protein
MDYIEQGIIVSFWLSKVLPFVLLGTLGFNLVQMLFKSALNSKRRASFYMSCVIGALCVASIYFAKNRISDFFLIPLWIAAIAVIIVRRKDFFPFAVRCVSCKTRLSLKRILFEEPSHCPSCEAKQSEINRQIM